MYSSNVFYPYIQSLQLDSLCMVSPDTGGTKRASTYAKVLDCDLAIGFKQREKQNEVSNLQIIGDVKGKNCIIVDDIIDTGGTLIKAANKLKENGAESVMAMCTHGLLSGNGLENIENSIIDKLILTDTIPLYKSSNKVEVVTVAHLLADVIKSVMERTSISNHFLFT
jgi:ribose-phosphate pyrophosphokinase